MYPVLTQKELAELVKKLSLIFDVVRIVDAGLQRVLSYDSEGKCHCSEYHCYDVWNKTKRCQNCISSLAYKDKTRVTKFEFVGNDIFHVTSQYIVVEDTPCLLEIVEKVSDLALCGTFGKEAFIERITEYTDRIYNDSLTKINNRRYYDEQIRYLNMSAVAMMDIDHFKHINDTYGHRCGDLFLAEVARVIRSCVSNQDSLIRYGGDEFLIAFPELSKEQFIDKLEDIRSNVNQICIPAYPDIKVSISIGCIWNTDKKIEHADKMMLFADRALYNAKITRNCVKLYEYS